MSTQQAAEGRGLGGEGTRRPSTGTQSTEVLHQTRKMKMSPAMMAVGGLLVVGVLGYVTMYSKSKPGTTPSEAAKVVSNTDGGTHAAANK